MSEMGHSCRFIPSGDRGKSDKNLKLSNRRWIEFFAGNDFPTPVSQIDRLERQNPNLGINVFGWEKEQVIVHWITEKGFDIPTINLMITT